MLENYLDRLENIYNSKTIIIEFYKNETIISNQPKWNRMAQLC